jgi:peptidoglycan/LPS O-acetylase OafA/YrhL
LAISAVLISHFGVSPAIDRLPFGFGVLFFFVLSSFLITRILLSVKDLNESNRISNNYSLKQFYIRRFLRIFPVYYLLIAVMYIINWYPCRTIIFSLLTYTTNFKIANGFNADCFLPLWSLAVEEQFYVFFPFLIFFLPVKNIFKVLISLVFIGLIGRAGLYVYNSQYILFSNFNTISCLDSLGIGAILAYTSMYKADRLKKIIDNRIYFASSVTIFLTTMVIFYSRYGGIEKYNFISIVFMRFFFNVMSFWILGWSVVFGYTGWIKKILENKVIVYIGRISYGIYLYHSFVPMAVTIFCHHFRLTDIAINPAIPLIIKICLYTSITIMIATISWYIIEKPLNNFKKYFKYNKPVQIIV